MTLYSSYEPEDDDDEKLRVAHALAGVAEPQGASTADEAAATHRMDDMQLSPDPSTPPEAVPIQAFDKRQTLETARDAVRPTGDSDSGDGDDFGSHINPWAIAASLLLNKGKDVGSILAMANDQAGRARQEKRQLLKDRSADEDRKTERGLQAARYAFDQKRAIASDARQKSGDDMRQWKETDDSQRAWDANADNEKKSSDAMQLQRDELTERAAHDRATESDARATHSDAASYRQQHALDMLDAKQQHDQDIADGKATVRADKLEKEADAFSTKYETSNKRSLDALSSLNAVDSILNKDRYKGKDLPGVGMVDSRKPEWMMALADQMPGADHEYQEDTRTVRTALPNLVNAVLREESGAAASDAERYSTALREGAAPGATEAQVRAALKASRELLEGRIRGGAIGNPERARSVLEAHKLPADLIEMPKSKGPDALTIATRRAEPSVTVVETPDNLGTTGQRERELPKVYERDGADPSEEDDVKKRFAKWRAARAR